jgi:polysaccharide biosynthesis/export protein
MITQPWQRLTKISGLLLTTTIATQLIWPSVVLAQRPRLLLAAPAQPAPEFFLGSGDVLEIKVFEYEEYTSSQVILPDGSITLPVIGRVLAADRTPAQLTQELTARLQPILVNPVVSVTLNKLRPIRVNVAGEVQRPGPIQLQSLAPTLTPNSSNPLRAPTLTEALLQAGGVTREADIRQVSLKRYHPTGQGVPVTIDLWATLRSGAAPEDVILQDGDTIVVAKLAPNAVSDRRLAAHASFAPKTVRVRVMGEVKKPGEVEVSPDGTLSAALAVAGGPTDKANLGRVAFLRMSDRGQLERQELDLKQLTDTVQVQDGDILMVPKSGGAKFLDAASQLLGPVGLFLNLFK